MLISDTKLPTNANSSILARSLLENLSLYFISIMYENPGGCEPQPSSADAYGVSKGAIREGAKGAEAPPLAKSKLRK